MKVTRVIGRVLVVGSLAALIAAPALADPPGSPPGQTGFSDARHEGPGKGLGHHDGNRGESGHAAPGHLPELDPGVAGSAALLLIGGTLVLRGRRRLEPQA